MSKKKYYIVKTKCKEVKAYNGSIMTPEDKVTYLSWTNEGGGWPTHSTDKASAKHFNKPPSKRTIADWDGMPWYYRIKSAEVIPVEELLIHEITELEAIPVE